MANVGMTTGQASGLIGIPAKRLRNWVASGAMKPSIKESSQGSGALYSERDLVKAVALTWLRTLVGRERWQASARALSGAVDSYAADQSLEGRVVVVDERGAWIEHEDEPELSRHALKRGAVLVVSLEAAQEEVDVAIARMRGGSEVAGVRAAA